MSFTNFIPGFGLEEKCKLSFDIYDVDRSGFLSIHKIEAIMLSTNIATKDLVKKRAETFMNCADTGRSGGITKDELIVAAEKLPTLLFPLHSKK
jgi:Ca2+-binding EF-hand superfamily protein